MDIVDFGSRAKPGGKKAPISMVVLHGRGLKQADGDGTEPWGH